MNMNKRLPLAILLTILVGLGGLVRLSYVHVKSSDAQSSGGGLYKVTTLDGGTCAGKGSKSSPLDCKVEVDNTVDTGLITIHASTILNANAYTRTSGSWITDGFEVGMTATFSGFTNAGNNGSKIVTNVMDLYLETSRAGMVNETGTGDERVLGGASITGDGTAANPLTAELALQGATFALFGQGHHGSINVTAAGKHLTKTTSDGLWNGGASSVETIAGDGYAQHTVAEMDRYRMFGLSVNDTNADYATIEYAIYTTALEMLAVYENGVIKYALNQTYYQGGDVLAVRRTGSTITYEKNGVVFYTSLVASTGSLRIDTSLHTQWTSIHDARLFDNGVETTVTWQNIQSNTVTLPYFVTISDSFYDDLKIEPGATYYTSNYRIFVRGTLTLDGYMEVYAAPGSNGNAGSAAVADCVSVAGGAAGGDGSLQNGYQGMNSAAGSTTTPVCLNGTCGNSSAIAQTHCVASGVANRGAASTGVGNNGLAGDVPCRGGGGGSGGGFVGTPSIVAANSQSLTPATTNNGSSRAWPNVLQGGQRLPTNLRFDSGGGGGAAGTCGRDTVNPTLQSPGGGAGGAGGGWMFVLARQTTGSGTLLAHGGAGGNGGSCGAHTGNAGGGGGGGGGAGGTIHLIYGTGSVLATNTAGGAGGTGGTACAGGSNGGNGGAGGAGQAYIFKAGI